MAEVALANVTRRFGNATAVSDLTLTVGDGELVVLLGPTGAGKTTTLRLIAGLETADSGRITTAGRDVTRLPPSARDVAFVFRRHSLYPHLSVFDNLAFPLRAPALNRSDADIRARVREIADLLKITAKLDSRPTALSAGETRRVAIGRALVRTPSIHLMDEPLFALDARLRSDLRLELKRIQETFGATILYVTDDQIEAMSMASRIGVMESGVLVQTGSPREIYETPRNIHVATRLGTPAINLLPQGLLDDAGAPAGTRTIGARTEHLGIEKVKGRRKSHGTVDRIEHLGDHNHLHINLGDTAKIVTLVALVAPGTDLGVGDRVAVQLRHPIWFDAAGNRIAARG